MSKRSFSARQIKTILDEAESKKTTISELCRKHSISDVTFFNWRKKYGGMSAENAERLKRMETENKKLTSKLAILEHEAEIISNILKKYLCDKKIIKEIISTMKAGGMRKERIISISGISRSSFYKNFS